MNATKTIVDYQKLNATKTIVDYQKLAALYKLPTSYRK